MAEVARDPIKKIVLKDGATRYRFVVDIGRHPATGKRQQKTHTFDRKGEARKKYDEIRHKVSEGTYIRPSDVTVNEVIDSFLRGATRGTRATTARSYRDAFRCPRELLGVRKAQTVSTDDIEELVDYMLTRGRKRGGKPGTGLSGRSVNLTLGRLKAAFELAVPEGKLVRNVVALVKPVSYRQAERETWNEAEVRKFLRETSRDRLEAAWRLSLYGLRRSEVLGLRWEDVDLTAKTLKIVQTRVLCGYETFIEEPKSRNGLRELPLDDDLVAALERLRMVQMAEREVAGPAYQADLSSLNWYVRGTYLVTDELGMPVHPEWYSGEFGRILRAVGLRRIALHDSRHTALSLMEKAHVPISIVSKWAGHYDSAFTQKTYVHAYGEDLKTGAQALAEIYRIA
ncbi:Site-specific recombinase XerD [Nocardiopsis rhodophaea]